SLIENVDISNRIRFVDIKSNEDYLYEHQINVCILSIYIGKKLRFKENKLQKLAMASLICDYGNLLLNNEKYFSDELLNEKEKREFEKHTSLGYDFFHNETDFKITEILPALEHHERIDGSGYPRGVCGDKIHLFSKIIALVDVFDALTSDRPYRVQYSQSEAIEILLKGAGTLYDYDLTKLFTENIVMYPKGTKVLLSSNDIGIVTCQNKDSKESPNIILMDKEYKKWINLSKNKDIKIIKVLKD
ncbi:MAG: HD domain-containing phosphohydrolase, partial [Bacillota bacterium]|nr:HD domain-containing phosphohydrolase [Bacillota bacterium]